MKGERKQWSILIFLFFTYLFFFPYFIFIIFLFSQYQTYLFHFPRRVLRFHQQPRQTFSQHHFSHSTTTLITSGLLTTSSSCHESLHRRHIPQPLPRFLKAPTRINCPCTDDTEQRTEAKNTLSYTPKLHMHQPFKALLKPLGILLALKVSRL